MQDLVEIDVYKDRIDWDKCSPFISWYFNLKEVTSILDVMYKILENEDYDFSNTIMETLPTRLQQKMQGICNNYMLLKENPNPDRFETGLESFYQGLNEIITETNDLLLKLENNRVHDAMNYLLEQYLIYLQEGINDTAPQWKFYLNNHLLTGLPTPVLKRAKLSGNVENESYQSRVWWTLFITTETKERLVLPKPKKIQEMGVYEITKELNKFCEPFSKMMQDCFDGLIKRVQQEQERVLIDFESKLKEARDEYSEIKDQIESDWRPLDEKASNLAKSFENLK